MDQNEIDKLALLSSPQVVRDNHALAAMVARHCGTAGPVLHTDKGTDAPVSVQGSDEANH